MCRNYCRISHCLEKVALILWFKYSVKITLPAVKFRQLATVTTFPCQVVKWQKSKPVKLQLKNNAYWIFLWWWAPDSLNKIWAPKLVMGNLWGKHVGGRGESVGKSCGLTISKSVKTILMSRGRSNCGLTDYVRIYISYLIRLHVH